MSNRTFIPVNTRIQWEQKLQPKAVSFEHRDKKVSLIKENRDGNMRS
jgi:hypothetical protein